ncbi:ABC1 domain-containing protein, partial [Haematococcus lacustris]
MSLWEEAAILLRGCYLLALFLPALVTAHTALWLGGSARLHWMQLVTWTLEQAGPAFIKWGQWGATRPDLFPPDLTTQLERLQTAAPAHSAQHSRAVVGASLGRPVHVLFDMFEDKPVASGSIAQVRHPGVAKVMQRDFVLMQRAVKLASALPGLAALRLEESVRQFGGPLQEQLDLGLEAAHLTRFRANFRLWPNVSFPNPIYPFVAKDVLVESFEDGALISTFVNQPDYKHRGMLAETGLTCYLQMLLRDNFIHALILLDTGMIAELSKPDQAGLITFFRALTKQDGAGLGQAILDMSERHTCKNPEAFVAALAAMFDALDPDYIHRHTSRVIESIIDTLRQHQVTLKSTVSTVVVTTLVLEGWSSKLNPDMRILDHMRDMLQADWGERIGRIVDKTMSSGSLAIA